MTVTAIIAEYNPFHNGHLYQLQKARQLTGADILLVMMSGDFIQRGGPACMNKYVRCQMALEAGADIVCELPSYGAAASAELFAASAVSLLNQLENIDYLCFGCETSDFQALNKLVDVLANEPEAYQTILKEILRTGVNFPSARSKALCRYLKDMQCADILNQPNNILAIEYMKALRRSNSRIRPVPIRRIGAGYHNPDASQPFSSATAIRHQLADNCHIQAGKNISVPESSRQLMQTYFEKQGILTCNDFSEIIAYRLLDPTLDLLSFADITEDIANRIDSRRRYFETVEQFINLTRSKNLTSARMCRCLFHILLDHRKDVLKAWTDSDYSGYLRVLGFRKPAASFFGQLSESAKSQLVMRTALAQKTLSGTALQMFKSDMYASELYRQALQTRYHSPQRDVYSEPLIVLSEEA